MVNIAAGAQHTSSADKAIAADNKALNGFQLFCNGGSSLCAPTPVISSVIQGNLTTLDNYNSAKGLGCSEGAGLTTGRGK